MKNQTGYSIAALLCEYSLDGGTGLSFPKLCLLFGPKYWEKSSVIEKLYFKRLAIHYKTTATFQLERKGIKPTKEEFLSSLFGHRIEEQNAVMDDHLNCIQIGPVACKVLHLQKCANY